MKKYFIILFVSLFVISFSGICETVDLTTMTNEELLILQARISDEIQSRKSDISNVDYQGFVPWFEDGFGSGLPDLACVIGHEYVEIENKLSKNTDSYFFITVEGITQDDFEYYVSVLEKCGFVDNIDKNDHRFTADRNMCTVRIMYFINEQRMELTYH